jgi:hypothetical protein
MEELELWMNNLVSDPKLDSFWDSWSTWIDDTPASSSDSHEGSPNPCSLSPGRYTFVDDTKQVVSKCAKGKSDHELREEFYRKEFRRQTGGKTPPKFFPNRSAVSESFIWRPKVNALYGINIPIYRRLNGTLDYEHEPARVRDKRKVQNFQCPQVVQKYSCKCV